MRDLRDFVREVERHEVHTTAHCVAALELFAARPARPLAGLAAFAKPEAVEAFFEALDWAQDPWLASHRGAGLYAALHLAGEIGEEWEDRYFAWLARKCDSATGCWRERWPRFPQEARPTGVRSSEPTPVYQVSRLGPSSRSSRNHGRLARGAAPLVAERFVCSRTTLRSPRETKGLEYRETHQACAEAKCC